jgi:PKD repeat protein
VTLAVSDGAAADYDDVTITVTSTINTPPVADANGPYSGTAGVAVVFDGSGSYDADGDALTYVWDFGDGFTGTGVSPIHAYAAGGVYTVTLVVSDGKENSSPSVTTATINTPPVADANGPYSGTVGLLVIFEGSGSSDADGDPLSYSWDFGDGGTGSGVTPSHTYAAGGVYTVTLIVNDGKIDSATSTATANINTPPVANANGPYFGTVGILLNFDGSGSFDADGDPLTYSWDFGDGETGSGESPSHTYALGGVYTVTLIVNDGKIDSTPSTTTATINTPPVADANGPYIEPATSWDGAWVDLDGSESYDPDGDTLTFVWKIGDHEIGTGAMLTYQFPFGETEVSLTVTDPSEASDTATTTVMVTLIDVEIDIKPGSYPNSINLGSNGVVPVAFLTDGGFDAATIDPSTITLAGHDFSGLVRMRGKGGQTPLASLEDVDADGDLDLVVQLETENLTLEPTDTICVLGALTFDGWVVQGEDTVRIVPE